MRQGNSQGIGRIQGDIQGSTTQDARDHARHLFLAGLAVPRDHLFNNAWRILADGHRASTCTPHDHAARLANAQCATHISPGKGGLDGKGVGLELHQKLLKLSLQMPQANRNQSFGGRLNHPTGHQTGTIGRHNERAIASHSGSRIDAQDDGPWAWVGHKVGRNHPWRLLNSFALPYPSSMHPAAPDPRQPQLGVRAVLVAAGRATRMGQGAGPRKPLIQLLGKSILEHSCAAFDASSDVTSIVIVAHQDDVELIRGLCRTGDAFRKVHAVLAGGAERGDSVRLGCEPELPQPLRSELEFDLIAVHDAARPLVRHGDISRTIQRAREHGAALLAVPIRDTLKHSADGQTGTMSPDRSGLWAAQTPQAFRADELRECQRQALAEGIQSTDDAALWERYRGPVQLVAGRWDNLKITEPEDLAIGEALLSAAQSNAKTP